jgi:AraC-like DNA-binding protein
MSHRQLSRVFRQRVGLGPKALIRLGRFQRALRLLDNPGRRSVAAVALRTGYYDQAHLARDFRLFAGVGPGRYLREAREIARNFIADVGEEERVIPSGARDRLAERMSPDAHSHEPADPSLRSG